MMNKEENMICSRCGKTINDEAVICPKCGEFTEKGALKLQEAAKQGSAVKENYNFTKTNLKTKNRGFGRFFGINHL
jgi:predicted RNA-binding Zn-ribbon protein involved in translation (DUF1610 family)